MKFKVLGGFGGRLSTCNMTSFLINDSILLDAGSISGVISLQEHALIKHVLISHSHLDHINGLPFFIDNLFGLNSSSVVLYSHKPTIDAVRSHMFNEITWPDFTRIMSNGFPLLQYKEIEPNTPFVLEQVEVTGIPVNHIVPTLGFLLREPDGGALLYTSDTGETEAVWAAANACEGLRAVVVECSFPNSMEQLAKVSRHLTPALLDGELKKLKREVPIFIYHIKPSYLDVMTQELSEIKGFSIAILEQGRVYEF